MPETVTAAATPRPLGEAARLLRRLESEAGVWRLIEAGLLAAFVLLIARWHTLINHDNALYLQCAELLLGGRVPYVDFVDINPPWVMYTMTPVVWMARLLSMPVSLAFMLMVGGAVAASWLELRALLGRSALALRPHEMGTLAVAWIGASMILFGMGDLGEREHLFMLAYVPFLALRLLRDEGRAPGVGWSVALGLQAGIGACFKPDFLVLALAAEIGLLIARRIWRWRPGPEVAAAVAVVVAYAAHWLIVPIAMRQAFFERWVPEVLRGYDAYSVSTGTMVKGLIEGGNVFAAALAALVVGKWLAWRGARTRTLLWPLVLLGAVALIDHVHQRREWSYHLAPFFMAGVLVGALVWIEARGALARRVALRRLRRDLVTVPAAAALMATVFCLVLALHVPHKDRPLAGAIEALTSKGDRVLVLSTSVIPAYPTLTLLDRQPGSRYLWDFPIAFYLHEIGRAGHSNASPEAREAEHRFLAELAEDIERTRPRLIVINLEDPPQGCPEGFHLETYLEAAGILELIDRRYQERPAPRGLRLFVRTDS